jgi:flagellar protein FlbD
LTRLHGQKIIVNADLIEFVESTPDTIVSTSTGKKLMVQESVETVIQRAVEYKRRCIENRSK